MTQWWIRHAVKRAPFPRWHFLKFGGPGGRESRGVVDLIAVRKDHSTPRNGLKRGDALQIILIQVKGGNAAKPTAEDAKRLRMVARRHGACAVLLAAWEKGTVVEGTSAEARFSLAAIGAGCCRRGSLPGGSSQEVLRRADRRLQGRAGGVYVRGACSR